MEIQKAIRSPKEKGNQMKNIGMETLRGMGLFVLLTAAVRLGWGSAGAEYRDLIDVSALKMESASTSLLLDVTRAGERLVAVGERGHIVISDDRGKTWTQAEVATRAGREGRAFAIHAPLLYLSKAQIIHEAGRLGVDLAATLSCYAPQPGGEAGGRGEACGLRA